MGKVSQLKCEGCGQFISGKIQGPCPKCGSTVRTLQISEVLRATETLSFKSIRHRWEHKKPLLIVVIIIMVGSPFVGLFIAGWNGVVLGFILSFASAVLGLFALTRVREEREWE